MFKYKDTERQKCSQAYINYIDFNKLLNGKYAVVNAHLQ